MINTASMPLQPGQSLFMGKYQIDAVIGTSVYTRLYRTRGTTSVPVHMLRVVQREATEIGAAVFSEYRRRFQTEVKLSKLLNHPNILRVHETNRDGDTLVLVMEYASGGSLAERLQALSQIGKQMPIDDCVHIMLEVTDALAAIHAENIVHRNLKPSKVLFSEEGRVKLSDLGLAQVPGEPVSRLKLRQSQMPHPGTPAYMSPEQKTISDYISPASDVYSLGLILFEMITGHVHRNMRPGSQASKLRHDIPAWLDQLLLRMLDENANQRPIDAAEVGKLLRDHAATTPAFPRVVGAPAAIALHPFELAPEAAPVRSAQPIALAQRPFGKATHPKRRMRKSTTLRHGGSSSASMALQPSGSVPPPPRDAQSSGESGAPRPHPNKSWLAVFVIVLLCVALGVGSAVLVSQPGLNLNPFTAMTSAAGTAEFLSRTVEPTRPRLKVTPSQTPAPATETPVESAVGTTRAVSPTLVAPALVLTPALGISIEFARVPEGDFVMGSSDSDPQSVPIEKPQHRINLPEFYIAKFEVTNEQFAVFLQSTGYTPTAWLTTTMSGKPNRPASPISWADANAFCEWMSMETGRVIQLPTEAQWEKAARGTDGRLYPWGNQPPSGALLNYDLLVKDTSPIGQYSPRGDSPYGIADMAGNVWEWTNTLFNDAQGQAYAYPYDSRDGRELLPAYSPAYRVLRGGSYLNDGSYVRDAARGADDQTQAHKGYGFRIVLMP